MEEKAAEKTFVYRTCCSNLNTINKIKFSQRELDIVVCIIFIARFGGRTTVSTQQK